MFDAFEVAIKLRLVDGLSSAMGIVTGKLIGANTHATDLQKRLDGISKTFTAGALMTGAGFGIAMALKASTNEAVRFEQALNRLKDLNLDLTYGSGSTSQLVTLAENISKATKGTSQTDALRLVTETQAITGDTQHTKEVAPMLAKLRFGMEAFMAKGGKGEGHGDASEKQFQDLVKVTETQGIFRNFSHEKMQNMFDLFAKNYVASGGMVKPSDFLAMVKTGGVAAKLVNSDFMFALGHVMQESGGNRAGTMLMSTYQNLVAGRTTQQTAENLRNFGLFGKESISYDSTGRITKVNPSALLDADLFKKNPLEYLETRILPKFAKKGIDIEDQAKVLPAFSSITSNRNASNFLAGLYMERSQLHNYTNQAKNAAGVEQLYSQGSSSTVGNQLELRANLMNLEKEFGTAVLPILVTVLEHAIPLVKSLGEAMKEHPALLKGLVVGLAGLAASLLIIGPMTTIVSAFKAIGVAAELGSKYLPLLGRGIMFLGRALLMNPIGLALTAIAGAAYLIYKNWDTLKPYFEKFWNIIKAVAITVSHVAAEAWDSVCKYFTPIADTITKVTSFIYNTITSIFSSIYNFVASSPIGKLIGWEIDLAKSAVSGAGQYIGKKSDAVNDWADRVNNSNKYISGAASGQFNMFGESRFISSGNKNNPVVQVTNHFDQNGITTMVAGGIAKSINKPQAGIFGFDATMAPFTPAMR